MRLDMNIVLEQKQELVLTPALKLSLEILQCNSLDLKARIEEELLENPLLEIRETRRSSRTYNSYEPWDQLEVQPSLKDHALNQFTHWDLEDGELDLLARLAEYLNSQGYLTDDYKKDSFFNDYSQDQMDKAIWQLQKLSPAGLGARNLSECLILQLRSQGHDTSIALDLVADDLEDVAAHRLDKLAKKYEMSVEDISEAISLIQSLDPRPGMAFGRKDRMGAQIADIHVIKEGESLSFNLNEAVYPDVYVDPYYRSLNLDELDDKSKVYISDRRKRANIFLEGLAQRRKTITRLMEVILAIQREFFFQGDRGMLPLNMLDVAKRLDCHESTVSRATNGKFLLFENQLYPLSHFFPSQVGAEEGRQVSSLYVKSLIEEMVAAEDPAKPLSDGALVKKIQEEDIKIARRTVAKYREEMGILSSLLRKNF